MTKFDTKADEKTIQKTIESLKNNGINALSVENQEEARKKIEEIIPRGSEVMSMTSVTLDESGIAKMINELGNYISVRNKIYSSDKKIDAKETKKLGAAADWAIGSVHAVTENGEIMIASNTGSQLPAYAYAAGRVVWVVGTHKIVKNIEEGFKRIYERSLPLESERAKKAYGVSGSAVNKILIINKEISEGRITLIFVNEVLGF